MPSLLSDELFEIIGSRDKLTFFQQFLWEIDELECQWKSLVSSRKGLQHMAVDWDESITAEDLKHVADFAGKYTTQCITQLRYMAPTTVG